MKKHAHTVLWSSGWLVGGVALFFLSQRGAESQDRREPDADRPRDESRQNPNGQQPPPFGQFNPGRGFGGPPPGGPGGGPPGGDELKLVKRFDQDKNGWLDQEERKPAREAARTERPARGGPGGGFGPPGGPGGQGGRPRGGFGPPGGGFGPPGGGGPGRGGPREPAKPGRKVAPEEVKTYADAPLYDAETLRTLFFEFENSDWEQELADFRNTDVDVPATLVVDGKKYPLVGVHFRGASSYFSVSEGYKRSFNISLDLAEKEQRLYGYKTLNLLNSNTDPSFLHTVLTFEIARQQKIPAPKANLVQVVINGESWGIYTNAQQFNKELIAENFPTADGARWKVPGSPGGGGGLEYLGDDPAQYERRYELKSGKSKDVWPQFIELCRVLNETPPDELEAALEPILDVDGALKFLALDVVTSNMDGYWVRASDYSIYLDPEGKFHVLPHDANETFQAGGMGPPPGMGPPGGFGGFFGPPGGPPPNGAGPDGGPRQEQGQGRGNGQGRDAGPGEGPGRGGRPGGRGPGGFGGGPGFGPGGGGGTELDPLIGLDDPRKPLRSKLLVVPKLKQRYLQYVHDIAEESLDWKQLGPVVASYVKLIDSAVKADTRKLSTYEAFQMAVSPKVPAASNDARRGPANLRSFAEQRRKFLLANKDVKEAMKTSAEK